MKCENCGHSQELHGKHGCEHERDKWVDYGNGDRLVAVRCGCAEFEPDDEDAA